MIDDRYVCVGSCVPSTLPRGEAHLPSCSDIVQARSASSLPRNTWPVVLQRHPHALGMEKSIRDCSVGVGDTSSMTAASFWCRTFNGYLSDQVETVDFEEGEFLLLFPI